MPEKTDEKKFEEELKKFKKQTSVENEEPAEVYNSNFMKSQNQTSRSPENKLKKFTFQTLIILILVILK